MKVKNILPLCLVALALNITGCDFSSLSHYKVPESSFDASRTPPAPDYSEVVNWAVLPGSGKEKRWMFSFSIRPHILETKAGTRQWPMNEMIKRAMDDIKNQTGIFEGQANIYAPFYRQTSLHALDAGEEDKNKALSVA